VVSGNVRSVVEMRHARRRRGRCLERVQCFSGNVEHNKEWGTSGDEAGTVFTGPSSK